MQMLRQFAGLTFAIAVTACAGRAHAQNRASDNAVTQAEDAFGFSVGRESLGIYNAGNARGFSPTAAGNVRIDGLYFDPTAGLSSTLVDSVGIKVGLSAQGYPFAAPSGIVDQTLRRPSAKDGASIVSNFDSFGSFGVEVDGSLVASNKLAFAYGLTGSHVEFPDGTNNWSHGQSLVASWRPVAGVEIVPFWSLYNDYDDEAGTYYVPAGSYLPKLPPQRHYEGPHWSDFRYTSTNAGVLASAAFSANWRLRLGAFRSVNDQKHAFTNLLVDERPDGTGERILFADPPSISRSISGELRLTHSIPDGPRLHVIHLSVRERDARREFGGSDLIDFGPGRIGDKVELPEPEFHFGEKSHDRLKQTTAGIAYDGRWRDVGEISFGVSQARFRKSTFVPGDPVAVSRSNPWLYNGTVAANLGKTTIVYAGYARGLEESGLAPPNAANRNQPLPVILTEQKDAGIRLSLARGIKAVAGIFDLSRPYFGYDSANVFTHVGTVRSRGAEFSLSGSLTPRVDIVAGGMLLKPRVTRDEGVQGVIGPRPVGFPSHLLNLNVNWRTPMLKGLELDLAVVHRGRAPGTTDNIVFVPARARVDIGTHYHFKLADRSATLRLQLSNLFDNAGFGLAGSGIYAQNPGRYVLGYLTVDI
jgi:iron complex outermembrane receptor protein